MTVGVMSAQNVKNVRVYEQDTVIYVLYDLKKTSDITLQVSLDVDNEKYIDIKDISGDVGKNIESAKGHIGEPYDWSFRPDNGKMYCSELIYECYINDDGTHLFNAKPMNFRDEEGNMPLFWIELFEKSGESIPEGVYGTNPNDMSKEPFLKEVHRYF